MAWWGYCVFGHYNSRPSNRPKRFCFCGAEIDSSRTNTPTDYE